MEPEPGSNVRDSASYPGITGALSFLSLTFAVAFVIRFVTVPKDSVINGDGAFYAMNAGTMLNGDFLGGISAYWSPLYSVLIAITAAFVPDLEVAGRLVSIMSGSLLVLPVFLLVSQLYGRLPAFVATILIAINPWLITASHWVMTESTYTLIFTAGILLAWNAFRTLSLPLFFVTGICFGAGYLLKPESLGYLLLLLVLTFSSMYFGQVRKKGLHLAGYGLILMGFSVVMLPYVGVISKKTGKWTISQKIVVNAPIEQGPSIEGDSMLRIMPSGRFTYQDRLLGDHYEIEDFKETDGTRVTDLNIAATETSGNALDLSFLTEGHALRLWIKQWRTYMPALVPYPLFIFLLPAFFYRRWDATRILKELFLLSFVIATMVGYSVTVVELRYLFPIIPVLTAWLALGLVACAEFTGAQLFASRTKTLTEYSLILVLLLLITVISAPLYSKLLLSPVSVRDVPFEDKRAGLWIHDHALASRPIVMSSSAVTAFYANGDHRFVPDVAFNEIIDYAAAIKADYLVISQRRLKDLPEAGSINNNLTDYRVSIVHEDKMTPGFGVTIYQLRHPD